jgi:hypothetical protein
MNAPLLRLTGQIIEIGERSIHGIDIFVIGNVVTEVDLRGREAGRNPDRIHTEILQIIQFRCDAIQIADAVIITVGKTTGINFIEDSVLPPRMFFRVRCARRFVCTSSQPRNAKHKQQNSHQSRRLLH